MAKCVQLKAPCHVCHVPSIGTKAENKQCKHGVSCCIVWFHYLNIIIMTHESRHIASSINTLIVIGWANNKQIPYILVLNTHMAKRFLG